MTLRSAGVTLLHHYYGHVQLPDEHLYILAIFGLSADIPLKFIRKFIRVSQVPTYSFQYYATALDPGRVVIFSPVTSITMLPSSACKLSASSNTRISELTAFTLVAAWYFSSVGFTKFVTSLSATR
jgi:hypothetical protein